VRFEVHTEVALKNISFTMRSGTSLPIFQRNTLHPSSGTKSKPSKQGVLDSLLEYITLRHCRWKLYVSP
jgi:hypothetical protein